MTYILHFGRMFCHYNLTTHTLGQETKGWDWRHDTQHNETQHDDIQKNDTEHSCIGYNVVILDVVYDERHSRWVLQNTLYAECHYDECRYAQCHCAI